MFLKEATVSSHEYLRVGVKEAPLSITSKTTSEWGNSVLLSRERVDSSLITKVNLNPLLNELLHPVVAEQLNSKDYLINGAYFTVPLGQGETVKSLENWGRAMPIGYGIIPYGEFIGGVVMVKGVSAAGEFYGKNTLNNNFPIGFFGDRDSKKEVDLANLLLKAGFRSSLPLGWIEFDNEGLKQWLVNRWKTYPQVQKSIVEHINTVKLNGDKCSMLFRICGNAERLESLNNFFLNLSSVSKAKGKNQRLTQEIARSARLMLIENRLFNDKYKRMFNDNDEGFYKAISVLGKISQRLIINPDDLLVYGDFLGKIIDENTTALEKLSLRNSYVFELLKALKQPKDIDLGFFSMDFETACENFQSLNEVEESIVDYNEWIKKWIKERHLPNCQEDGLIKVS